jgi:3-deoxy-D-manno-octulosonate 8-phosphate phosphatase (KDO 8-P phosphatase)
MPYPDLSEIPAALLARAAQVRLACFDVDGVLTDGKLWFGADGQERLKAFHVRDGLGIKLLEDHGITVAVISARSHPALVARARELGIRHLHQGERDKLARLDSVCESLGLVLEQVAYVGDDLPDLAPMAGAGLAIAVADAHPWVRERAHWCTANRGGDGAVREVADLLLAAQEKTAAALARFLQAP